MDVRPGAGEESGRALDSALRKDEMRRDRVPAESASFLSTHLLRELIAADAQSDAGGDALPERATALLQVVLSGLDLGEGAIVLAHPAGDGGVCVAVRGIPDHARELLEARAAQHESLGPSLLQRALAERRVLLLDRTTREPLMPALRDGNPDVECAVVVPLHDQGTAVGVLLLAARGRRLSPPFLRSLAVAFRLLGLLLSPGRGKAAGPVRVEEPPAGSGDGERYLFEIEELTARLGEAQAATQQLEERATSAEAGLRAEQEGARARIAELEAQLAGVAPARDRELELESLCAEQSRTIEQQERRVADLERELGVLLERAALHAEGRTVDLSAEAGWAENALHEAEIEARAAAPLDGEPVEPTIELTEGGDEQLGEIAAAAAAAIGDTSGDEDAAAALDDDAAEIAIGDEERIEVEAMALDEEAGAGAAAAEVAAAEVAAEPAGAAYALAVLHVDQRPGARAAARSSAEDVGAAYWSGDDALPSAASSIVAVNLLDEALLQMVAGEADVWSAGRWIVYGAAGDAGTGFELGACALVRRPLEPRACLEQLQRSAGRKPTGTLIVSAQLREVAGLRQALQEVDIAGSVACDVRQALDLLEIVRRPDAVLIDLALPQGQGLALAAQLRRQPETSSLPLLLLLPATVEPERLRADADRAQLLGPFGDEDVQRLVRARLAGRA